MGKNRAKHSGRFEEKSKNSLSDASVAPLMKLGSNPTMQSINRAKTTRFSVIFFPLPLSLSLSRNQMRQEKTQFVKVQTFVFRDLF